MSGSQPPLATLGGAMANGAPTFVAARHRWPAAVRAAAERHLARTLCAAIAAAALFGISLTSYTLTVAGHPYLLQSISSAIKIPLILSIGAGVATLSACALVGLVGGPLRPREVAHAALTGFVATALWLGLFAVPMALVSTGGNYSITVLTSYVLLASAVGLGCHVFRRRVSVRGRAASRTSHVLVTMVWALCFSLSSAELSWSLRPLIGWTGQPFEWVRKDSTPIWNQLRCELRNMRFGGIRFPQAGEDSPFKQWPC